MTREDMDFIKSLFRSLEAQMDWRFAEMLGHVDEKFDQTAARLGQMAGRLDRIGGLVNRERQ